jgi:hypothetical protein
MDKCIYCNSTDLIRDIKIGLTAECGHVGLDYSGFLGIVGTEPLYADLCNSCGSIVRFHVLTTDHKYVIKKHKS